jgi:hypothetical protein
MTIKLVGLEQVVGTLPAIDEPKLLSRRFSAGILALLILRY